MQALDVFNGDADGICALHQLRLNKPQPDAELITGVKRDIRLLDKLQHHRNAEVTVLDISMDTNRQGLTALLDNGCRVLYIDHHFPGPIPDHPLLEAHINTTPETCSSLIVDQLLHGRYRTWAIAAAFGDNLHETAMQIAASLFLSEDKSATLKEIGELLNYNGYGFTTDDLHIHPRELYRAVAEFTDPFVFAEESMELKTLRTGFLNDMAKTTECRAVHTAAGRVFILPAAAWARRTVGIFSNEKAREKPEVAHAILVDNLDNTYRVSVRAPLARKNGADALCRQFPTGGGRTAAAGINVLPKENLDTFIEKFTTAFRT